jgi:hypothetical protein
MENASSDNLLRLIDTPFSSTPYANPQPSFTIARSSQTPRATKGVKSRYEKQPGGVRAANMPKKDSALILATWRGTLDWPDVHALVEHRLSIAKTESQIKAHALTMARNEGSWERALELATTFKSRPRQFKRKCPFDARAKLAIALFLRDCYHDRHRFRIVTARLKEWFRANGVPSYINIESTGTGPGTLHEKIKNHGRNNIDIRFKRNLEAAIAAFTLEVELEASEALPTPPADISTRPSSPLTTNVASWHNRSPTPPTATPAPAHPQSPFPIPAFVESSYQFPPPMAPLVFPQHMPDVSPRPDVVAPSDLALQSHSHNELMCDGYSFNDSRNPFHILASFNNWSEDNGVS